MSIARGVEGWALDPENFVRSGGDNLIGTRPRTRSVAPELTARNTQGPVRDTINSGTYRYRVSAVVGKGSFGMVFKGRCLETGQTVAIKKVFEDPRYKNRELQIMRELNHPTVVQLLDFFHTTEKTDRQGLNYLNLVMNFMPSTVHRLCRIFSRRQEPVPLIETKIYIYQALQALDHLHAKGITHRDIKPQNLLINPQTYRLKLCDFGSAKRLVPGEPSVAYICSRYYRAPELMLGSTDYTCAVDLWSMGCILGEFLHGGVLFPGETPLDQLIKIIQILGTPTMEQLTAMKVDTTEVDMPSLKGVCLNQFLIKADPLMVDLLSQLLQFEPDARIKAKAALNHPCFDDVKGGEAILPIGCDWSQLTGAPAPSEVA